MSKKNTLVFGASGFIGTYLIDELLSQGHRVVASDLSDVSRSYYDIKNIPYIAVDITKESDFEKLDNEKFDSIIHLAACQPANISKDKYNPRDYINVNIIGTLNILEYCKASKAGKIIYASSHRNTQGLWADHEVIREGDGRGLKYSGEYAMFSISESAAQDCVFHYQAQHGLRGIVFRLPPVYGYGPHTEIFKDGKPIKTGFQIFIEKAKASMPLEIWGDGDIGRDIIYIKDVVSAFIKAIQSPTASGLFNIASGKYLTLREQVNTIANLFWGSKTLPEIIEYPEKVNDIDQFRYDISKAQRELDWTPEYCFRDMLIDYEKEFESKKYEHLVEKRKHMFN